MIFSQALILFDQAWYLALVLTIGNMFLDESFEHTYLNQCISLSLYAQGITWAFYYAFYTNQIFLIITCSLGVAVGGNYLLHLIRTANIAVPQHSYFFRAAIVSFIFGIVGISLVLALSENFDVLRYICEVANAGLLFSPFISQQISQVTAIMAPLQFYIFAIGFAVFWALAIVIQLDAQNYVDFFISFVCAIGCAQQYLAYFSHGFRRLTGSNGSSGSNGAQKQQPVIVLRELRYHHSWDRRISGTEEDLSESKHADESAPINIKSGFVTYV